MADRAPLFLQQDEHRSVRVEADGTVTKTFNGPRAREEAEREADRLRGLQRALQAVRGATCPAVLDVEGPPWRVHMARAPGEPLATRLAESLLPAAELAATADVLAEAVGCYVRTFSEPYYDFHLRNVLSDPSTSTLAFVDFGVPRELEGVLEVLRAHDPLEVSLGNLVGSTVFEALRPGAVRVRRPNKAQSFALARAVVVRCVRGGDAPRPAGVAAMARLSYARSAHEGSLVRRAWYFARGGVTRQALRAIARISDERR